MSLVPCAACRRHVKAGGCPFCARKQASAAAVLLLGAALSGCQPEAVPPASADSTKATSTASAAQTPAGATATATATVAATATATATVAASASASTTSVASTPAPTATAVKPPPPVQPDRPVMARYGIAPSRN
jgi:hypothetical protein